MNNNFVFADLSTFGLDIAKSFYSKVFGWSFFSEDDSYYLASYHKKEICGLYESPKKFRDMGMPSFWMSYIRVDDLEKTVEKARQLGGIIELVDDNLPIGKIALIRDPLGAGFTVYQGNLLNSRFNNEENTLVWNELFISDISRIRPFYEGIFDWKFQETENRRFLIKNSSNETVGAIQEVANKIKGDKEYWSVFFGVKNIEDIKSKVKANGGKLVYEDGTTTILEDPFGAFFHIVPIQQNQAVFSSKKPVPWKAILGLTLVILSLITEWHWIWGIFFALWVISDLRSGSTYLL
ncbi:MAG: VOC family protein, partial [Bacteroidota bacterium]